MVHISVQWWLLFCCCTLALVLEGQGQGVTGTESLKRGRRYIVFPKNARSGIRVNWKHNRVVPITAILAYSDGMRLTWDLPTDTKFFRPKIGRRSAQRRNVFDFLQTALSYGLDGEACVLRALCEAAEMETPASGLINKILHKIFLIPEDELRLSQDEEQRGEEERSSRDWWYHSREPRELAEGCQARFAYRCPFSLLGPSVMNLNEPHHEIHPKD